jgi:hypothetical protein
MNALKTFARSAGVQPPFVKEPNRVFERGVGLLFLYYTSTNSAEAGGMVVRNMISI